MKPSETSGEIRGKDIIQTDAAIIAGILILLTISSFSPFEFPNRSMFVSLIIPAIALFSISALYVIEKKLVMGKRFTKVGFYWLIGFMIFLMIVNVINVISPTIWQDPTFEKIASSNVSSIAQ
ncbi:MAG: hypothetical protein M3297_14345 [Thermoproteota archaeon]|jgi:hypothetical protein|nr:hypothetical protein [Thermoproteota archaeon]